MLFHMHNSANTAPCNDFPYSCKPNCSVYDHNCLPQEGEMLDSSLIEFTIEFKTRWSQDPFQHGLDRNLDTGKNNPLMVTKSTGSVTIPAITPTFSSPSHPTTSPEVPCDTSSSHVPLGSHVIHPRAPPSCPMPCEPISHPHWVRLRELPPSTPNTPDEPESSADPQIDSAVLTKDLSILQGLLSGLPMSLWSAVLDVTDTDGH